VEEYIAAHGLYRGAGGSRTGSDAQFIEIIRGRLTQRRFHHSLAVSEQAVHLAELYGADPKKAYTAGILHDIMKDTGREAQLQILGDFGIILDNVEKALPGCWHAMAGAVFIEHILHVSDRDIINAVRYHTTARAGMSLLEEIVYLADFTSADRDYPDVDKMRGLAESDKDAAMEYALSYTIRDLVGKAAAVHPDAIHAYNERIAAKRKGVIHHAAK
jgi:nicotinate-nucleotide adenylyltransferase